MPPTLEKVKQLPLRAARKLLREGVRRLPVSSQLLGPPKSTNATIQQWCEQNAHQGAEYHFLESEGVETVPRPATVEELPKKYINQLTIRCLPQYTAVIPHGRVCHGGLVISPDDYVLSDTTYETHLARANNMRLPILNAIKLPRKRVESGTIAVISSLWAQNYYHWFFDILPRVGILRKSNLACDRYIVSCETPFQRQSLQLLGITPDQCVPDTPDLHLQAERLIVPSLPGWQGAPTSWMVRFLQETILNPILAHHLPAESEDHSSGMGKRLYINRADHLVRCVTNKADVLRVLEPKGFQSITLDDMSLAEQALLFHHAEAIVAPHGAALTNLFFCRPGTRVIEFAAPGWTYPLYNNIACHAKLRYGYLIGAGQRPLLRNHVAYRGENITVNIAELEAMLEMMEI